MSAGRFIDSHAAALVDGYGLSAVYVRFGFVQGFFDFAAGEGAGHGELFFYRAGESFREIQALVVNAFEFLRSKITLHDVVLFHAAELRGVSLALVESFRAFHVLPERAELLAPKFLLVHLVHQRAQYLYGGVYMPRKIDRLIKYGKFLGDG